MGWLRCRFLSGNHQAAVQAAAGPEDFAKKVLGNLG